MRSHAGTAGPKEAPVRRLPLPRSHGPTETGARPPRLRSRVRFVQAGEFVPTPTPPGPRSGRTCRSWCSRSWTRRCMSSGGMSPRRPG